MFSQVQDLQRRVFYYGLDDNLDNINKVEVDGEICTLVEGGKSSIKYISFRPILQAR
jgi:hypothetical protein